MKLQWQIRDIIDLEYFLYKDEDIREDTDYSLLFQNDRNLYLNHIKPTLLSSRKPVDDRKWILRLWLEYKKKTAGTGSEDRILPGESFQTIFRLMLLLAITAGCMTGFAATLSFLFYQGQSPINVSAFLGIFVLLQMVLILITIFLSIIRKHMGLLHHFSITHSLLAFLLSKLIFKLQKNLTTPLPAKDKNSVLAAIGVVKGKQSHYGSAFYWLFFILVQIFSVCFNAGILLAMILKVIISDLAFGWQSTIQFSAQTVHQAVTLLSLPWSWLVPMDLAHPTIEQIEGSRIILKDGIHHLSTSGMISWWPFLCFSVLCYGLIPRAILLLVGILRHKRAMSKIDFRTADCDQLLRNLTTPVISTSGTPIEQLPDKYPSFDPVLNNGIQKNDDKRPLPDSHIIAIVPDDIDASCPEDELRKHIAKTTGHELVQKISVGADQTGSAELIKKISGSLSDHPNTGILVLQEAWQPPIRETLLFLRLIRKNIGNKPIIRISLIGKPSPKTIFTKPGRNDVVVWKQSIASLGDPAMIVDILGGEES